MKVKPECRRSHADRGPGPQDRRQPAIAAVLRGAAPAAAGALPSGYRDYTEDDVTAVRHIRALLAAGLRTAVIAELLPCIRDDGERLIPTCPDMITQLRRERAQIIDTIAQLQISRNLLDTILAADPTPSEMSHRLGMSFSATA